MTCLGRTVLIIALTLGSTGIALGQTPATPAPVDSARLVWAEKLLEVTHAQRAFLTGFDSALATQRKNTAKKGAQLYLDSLTARAGREAPEFVDSLAVIWTGQLSLPDLQQLVAFYQTPLGQRYADAQVWAALQMKALGERWGARLALDVMRDLLDKGLISPADLGN